MSDELRPIFEAIIREARQLGTSTGTRQNMLDERREQIVALAERGLTTLAHNPTCVETREPYWEEHDAPRRWMVVCVGRNRFDPHMETATCKSRGCAPALPHEIPFVDATMEIPTYHGEPDA